MDTVRGLRREARRLELLEAAIAVIRRAGPGASMDEIAAEAGITKPIVYRHLGDRAGLYQALARRHAVELAGRLPAATAGDLRAQARALVDAYLAFAERDPHVFQFLAQPERAAQAGARPAPSFTGLLGEELAALLRRRLAAADLPTEPAASWGQAVAGMLEAAASWWAAQPGLPRTRLAEQLTSLLWAGLGGAPGHAGVARPSAAGAPALRGRAARL